MKNNFLLSIGREKLSRSQDRGRRVVMLSTMIVMLTGIIAFASIPGADGVIHGCYNKNGDSSLRVIDSTAQCKSNEIALNFNQTGPQGLQGLQGFQGAPGADGAAGANGISEAYFARQTGFTRRIDILREDILSKNVPAGSYVINAKVQARSNDTSNIFVECGLSTGDFSSPTLRQSDRQIVALQDAVTFDAPATITLFCSGQNVVVEHFVMTAIKVDAIY